MKGKAVMSTDVSPNTHRARYERMKDGEHFAFGYDPNMEYQKTSDVESGAWVLVTRTVPVNNGCRPHLFGIYWGIPKQDAYDRQTCVVHTTEDVTLLNHEFTVINDAKLQIYREEGWELHETGADTSQHLDMSLIENGRNLCEEEREIIWALQLDGLSEMQACEEYFLSRHTDYNNFAICYIPNQDVFAKCVNAFGTR